MKKRRSKYYIIAGVVALALLWGFIWGVPLAKAYLFDDCYQLDEQPVIALYNRDNPEMLNGVDHYNIILKSTAIWSDQRPLKNDMARHDVLITIETWLKGQAAMGDILTSITQGKFDSKIKALAQMVAKSPHQVYIRWAPDMDVPARIYPWQYQSATAYIQSFNYFSRKFKQYAPNAKIVWGTSGYPGDTEYWPGNKYVDLVSITLGSKSEYSVNEYPPARSVPEMLRMKLHRLRFINKPVLIIGPNSASKTGFKPVWLSDEAAYMHQFDSTVYSAANYADSDKVKPQRTFLKVGAFDPNQRIISQKRITVEHIFTDMGQVQRGIFEKEFREIIGRHHDVIVTLEPWRDTSGVVDTALMQSIVSGRYDAEIKKVFHIISATQQTIYLRWMHEMEIPIHRYAWQSQDPVAYIKAFRYLMKFEGGPAKNVKKVWGPAGDRGSIDFWPGDDVVDYISIAIYGLPNKNITDPNQQEAFSTIFNRKFHRMRFSDKPLFITEFGVKGPEDYQDKWLADAARTINANRAVFGLCYFNLYDNPKAWGHIKAPDWSITPRSMNKFCSLLK